MPTAPFNKQIVLWGDSRITANITEAEAFHTWAENEGISHRFEQDGNELWLTVYTTSTTQIDTCNDWLSAHRTGCYTA